MYEALYTMTNVLFAQFFDPARRYNALVFDNFGKVAEFQLDSLRSYTDIGLRPLREALRVNDGEGFQRLMLSQNEAGHTLVAKFMADTQTLVGFGQTFGQEVQNLLTQAGDASVTGGAVSDAIKPTASAAGRKPG